MARYVNPKTFFSIINAFIYIIATQIIQFTIVVEALSVDG